MATNKQQHQQQLSVSKTDNRTFSFIAPGDYHSTAAITQFSWWSVSHRVVWRISVKRRSYRLLWGVQCYQELQPYLHSAISPSHPTTTALFTPWCCIGHCHYQWRIWDVLLEGERGRGPYAYIAYCCTSSISMSCETLVISLCVYTPACLRHAATEVWR